MGMDASLFVKLKREIPEEELRELNYRFKEASSFGYGPNPIQKSTYDWTPKDGIYYEIDSISRYYGPHYARGYFPEIYMAIQWLKGNLDAPTIYYGGDSSVDDTPLLTAENEKELLGYWIKNGGLTYRGDPPKESRFHKECPYHKVIMAQYSWSGESGAGVRCQGCGHKEETKDGGKTWEIMKDYD